MAGVGANVDAKLRKDRCDVWETWMGETWMGETWIQGKRNLDVRWEKLGFKVRETWM